MLRFAFEVIVALLLLGVIWWVAGAVGLPHPIPLVVAVLCALILLAFLYQRFPGGPRSI